VAFAVVASSVEADISQPWWNADEQLCDNLWALRVDAALAKGGAGSAQPFFGIGINGEPDIAAGEAILASQYVSTGKTQIEAQEQVASLNACFGTYEVPAENRNHPELANPMQLRHVQSSNGN
jgi:hypothetical protein